MSVHKGVNYPCNQCASKFTQKGDLKKHKIAVHEGNNYLCNQCDSKFTAMGSLKRHNVSIHKGLKCQIN